MSKGYVNNHNRPEGCTVECFIYEEVIVFCSEYLINVEAMGLPNSHFTKTKMTITKLDNRWLLSVKT